MAYLRQMAVRKIGINCRSITGAHGKSGQRFESGLERDFLELLAFDPSVSGYETQPLILHYLFDGDERPYRPDVLVSYHPDHLSDGQPSHLLAEIKYREEYRGLFRELRPRLMAARRYARSRGWQFRVFTEREIRTPYLLNARFLRPYRSYPEDSAKAEEILAYLGMVPDSTPNKLLQALRTNEIGRAELLPIVWKLIADQEVATDLMVELHMNSRIWCMAE